MHRRHKLGLRHSKRMFTKYAQKVHPRNAYRLTGPGGVMRGGERL